MASPVRQRMRVDEFSALSEGDPRRLDLVDGEIVVNEPRGHHARLQALLIGELTAWEQRVPGRALVYGPTAIELTPYDHYGPDVVIARPYARMDEREYLAEPPLICVEIRSPSTWRYDVGRKKSVYEAGGVPEVWLVDDVAEVVLVFRRSTAEQATYDVALELGVGDVLDSPQLPGFELALEWLFEPPLRS